MPLLLRSSGFMTLAVTIFATTVNRIYVTFRSTVAAVARVTLIFSVIPIYSREQIHYTSCMRSKAAMPAG